MWFRAKVLPECVSLDLDAPSVQTAGVFHFPEFDSFGQSAQRSITNLAASFEQEKERGGMPTMALAKMLRSGVAEDNLVQYSCLPTQLSLLVRQSCLGLKLEDRPLSQYWLWHSSGFPVALSGITVAPNSQYEYERYLVKLSTQEPVGMSGDVKKPKRGYASLVVQFGKDQSKLGLTLGGWLAINKLELLTQEKLDAYLADYATAQELLLDMHRSVYTCAGRPGAQFALLDYREHEESSTTSVHPAPPYVLHLSLLENGPVRLDWPALSLRDGTTCNVPLAELDPLPWLEDDSFDTLVLEQRVYSGLHLLAAASQAPQSSHDVASGRGNLILVLLQGAPGTGKTASAEILASVTHHGLYRVPLTRLLSHRNIGEALEEEMQTARAANCIVLIDEADLIVRSRGIDLAHNALVANLLTTLEYMNGLLFMTTNRAGDIDPAIKSRCSAILTFKAPDPAGMRLVWENNFTRCNFAVVLSPAQWDRILSVDMSPRDVVLSVNHLYRYKQPQSELLINCATGTPEADEDFELLLDTISLVTGEDVDGVGV